MFYKHPQERIDKALSLIAEGVPEGDHHKAWLLDQLVKTLTRSGAEYLKFIDEYPGEWDRGIAP